MKNDYQIGSVRISIPPTLLFSTLGKMEDVRKAVTMDVKKAGGPRLRPGKDLPGARRIGVVRPPRRYRKQRPEGQCRNGKGPLRSPPPGDHGGARRLLPRLLRRGARRGPRGDGLRRRPGAGDRSRGGAGGGDRPERRAPLFGIPEPLRRDRLARKRGRPLRRSSPVRPAPGSERSSPKGCSGSTASAGNRIIEEELAALKAAWQKPLAF